MTSTSPRTRGAVAWVCAVLAGTHVALGWWLGFQSIPAYLVSWIFFAAVGLSAWRLARFLFQSSGSYDLVIRTAVLAFALIVGTGLALGSLRLIRIGPYLCVFGVALVASAFLRPGTSSPSALPDRLPVAAAALLVPLLAFVVAVGVVRSPLTLYDSLSYHLVFPARWLQDSALSIVQTPFSDPAQAYQPANGELFFLWLMLPFHGDLLARIGQLPFLLLAGFGLYAVARRCGARPEHAAYAPLFFCFVRPVVEQAVGADVDLVCTSMFVTSLYLGLIAVDDDTPRDWAMWGVSMGLFLGSKYLAVAFAPVLLLLPFVRGIRPRALWALAGIVVFALPWYARNWIVAGSPLYPASLDILGMVVARGAFPRAALNNSVFHVTSVRLFPAIAAHAFGAAAALVCVPAATAGLMAVVARRQWWPQGYVAVLPLFMGLLFWFALPDNADSRFLLPAVAVVTILPTLAFQSRPSADAWLHGLYLLGTAWMIVGSSRQPAVSLPWFMGDWLALDGMIARDSLAVYLGAVAATGAVAVAARRVRMPAVTWTVPSVCAGAICLAMVWPIGAAPDASTTPLVLSPTYVRAGMITGWEWTLRHVSDSNVAYTGNNVPYPLFGAQLTNRVQYVNIDRHAEWRFHDYARAKERAGKPATSSFAQPSGQLMPLLSEVQSGASRPRFERWDGLREAWIGNLRASHVSCLFVSALSAYEIGYSWHNAEGFPIEDEWARSEPAVFQLLYENGQVRVYAVDSR